MANRRVTIPEGQVAVLLPVQLSAELQSLIMSRRRKLGVTMSRLNQAEVNVQGHDQDAINKSVARQDRWHQAKVERDILNDFLLALIDAEVEGRL